MKNEIDKTETAREKMGLLAVQHPNVINVMKKVV
jgi:hypothetical protein